MEVPFDRYEAHKNDSTNRFDVVPTEQSAPGTIGVQAMNGK